MKPKRQREILGLVESRRVATQHELSAALADRGIAVSQGTLSRDLRELGIVKTAKGYTRAGHIRQTDLQRQALARAVSQFLVGITTAQNLVVLRTHPGGASALAQFLDAAKWPEIVGTIAGDDTIFAATKDIITARKVRNMLEAL